MHKVTLFKKVSRTPGVSDSRVGKSHASTSPERPGMGTEEKQDSQLLHSLIEETQASSGARPFKQSKQRGVL